MDGKYDFPMEICLNDTQAKDELKAFHKLVSSSMGPRGHLKMVLSLADTMIVTSSSDRLFDFMRLDSPLVEILVSTSKSLSDFRLYFCSLAVQLLDVQDKFGNKTVDLSVLPDILEKARIKIDIGDVFSLMSLITTNLTSNIILYINTINII
ncbi:uncharacterized protein LOC111705098 [Eurytemora carolleeae]|uniref:uncharacterized protein LOC111705098 n=1 Tax=Eurytemora carolleeae TaxID=1294199 RepID=UPI000C75ECAC|nr:uncharacterized protein LOC111705098 [Eurytemora carolleeae]|eukprot:XP_023333310.1 uncharacterized protein LOC111705098 [Eurytemora affinis]